VKKKIIIGYGVQHLFVKNNLNYIFLPIIFGFLIIFLRSVGLCDCYGDEIPTLYKDYYIAEHEIIVAGPKFFYLFLDFFGLRNPIGANIYLFSVSTIFLFLFLNFTRNKSIFFMCYLPLIPFILFFSSGLLRFLIIIILFMLFLKTKNISRYFFLVSIFFFHPSYFFITLFIIFIYSKIIRPIKWTILILIPLMLFFIYEYGYLIPGIGDLTHYLWTLKHDGSYAWPIIMDSYLYSKILGIIFGNWSLVSIYLRLSIFLLIILVFKMQANSNSEQYFNVIFFLVISILISLNQGNEITFIRHMIISSLLFIIFLNYKFVKKPN
jgi:hypothetical protein